MIREREKKIKEKMERETREVREVRKMWEVRKVRKMRKTRKAQEEMIGFVLIIILVSVIALIFLAISVRKPREMQKSKEIENFLHSSLLFTTSCKASVEITYDFKDLIKACFEDEKCIDGRDVCEVLNETAFELVESSFVIGEEARYKGYEFKIYDWQNTIILYLSKGKKTGSQYGAKTEIPVEGESLHVVMSLYY